MAGIGERFSSLPGNISWPKPRIVHRRGRPAAAARASATRKKECALQSWPASELAWVLSTAALSDQDAHDHRRHHNHHEPYEGPMLEKNRSNTFVREHHQGKPAQRER